MKRFLLSILFFVGVVSVGFGQSIGDFQTRQTGSWNDSNTWEEWDGAAWVNMANTPTSANGVVSILNSHNVTVTAAVTVDQITINNGGQITVASGISLTINDGSGDDLTVNSGGTLTNLGTFKTGTGGKGGPAGQVRVLGVFENQGSVTNFSSANLFFESGSVYDHQFTTTEGTVPSASWDVNSTVKVTGYTSLTILSITGNWSQPFGNFEWNTPNLTAGGQGWFDMDGFVTTANGNFNIYNTGGIILYLTDITQALTLNVGGNVNLDGANTYVGCTYSGKSMTWNVSGNFNITNSALLESTESQPVNINVTGNFNVNTVSNGVNLTIGSSGTTFDLDGDLNIVAGSITETGTGTNSIIFSGGVLQNFTNTGAGFSNTINFSINNSSTLDLSTYALTGSGTFEIGAGSTLITANADGITTGNTTGAIRVTGTRTFNTGATIGYDGTVAQSLGGGFPASGVSLTINNTGGGVNMASNLTISSLQILTLTAGTLNIGANTLTLDGNVSTTNGGLSGGSTSNLSIGGTGAFGTLGFVGTTELGDFTINRTSTGSVTLGGPLTTRGTFTQSAGDFILNGNVFNINGPFAQSGGTIIPDATSALLITGSGSLPGTVAFTGNVRKITLDRASAIFETAASEINADTLNAFSGDFSYNGGSVSVNAGGYVERRETGTFSQPLTSTGSYDLVYNISTAISTGPELPTATTTLNNLTKRGTATLSVAANTTINGILTLSNGGFNAGTAAIDLKGNFVSNAQSTLTSSLLTFSGITNLTGSVNPSFGNITVSGEFNPASNLTVQGDITNNGILNTTAGTITFAGTSNLLGTNAIRVNNITLNTGSSVVANSAANLRIDGAFSNSGTFNANGGNVVFGGSTSITGTVPTFANVQVDGTLNAPTSLEITNNFENNGTFVHNDGQVRFTTNATAISGTATTSFYDLSIENGNVSVNGTVNLENIMSFTGSPTVDFDGGGAGVFTLKSIPGQDAAIGNIGTATVSGNITAERYIVRRDQTLDRGYHIVGFPSTGVTVADIQNELPINGTFTGASGYVGDGSINPNNPSLYRYNESLGGALGARYSAFPPSTNTTDFANGEGYHLFTFTGLAPLTINGRGAIKAGGFSRSLTYTGTEPDAGWHTIANPYPSASDWSQWGRADINAGTAHLYDPQSGQYIALDGTTQQLIPQGQGFFVKVDAAGTITATEATKVTGSTPTFYRTSDSPLERFEIILRKDTIDDIAIVSFNENATDNYEAAYDADRLLNAKETFSTLTADGKAVKVNRLASLYNTESCSRSINFKMEQMVNGRDYKLLFRDLDHLPSQSFVLMDHYLGQTVKVTNSTIYDFQVNTDAASKNDARFELILSSNQPSQVVTVAEDICPEQNALITIENSQSFVNYIVLKNNEIISSVAGSGADLGIEISNDILIDDVNDFVIQGYVSGCDTVSVGNAQIQVNEALTLDNVVDGSLICNVDTQAPFSLSTQIGANYYILNGQDTIQTIQATGNIYEGFISSTDLNDGLNEFVIAAEKDGCQNGTLTQNLQIEVQNPTIDSSIAFSSENTCLATASTISFNGQAGVVYQIFKGTTLVNSITADSTEQIVNIPEANLTVGVNEFTILAQYGQCAEYEFPNPVQIQVEENINTNLSLITENTCGDANTSIIIQNAQAGKTYTLQSAGVNITSLTANVDGELIFNLNSNQLSTGVNELDIQIEGQICGAVLSANKAVFSVYDSINSNLEYISTNVCNATEASVGISNAQAGKIYRLYQGASLVESIQATTDGQLLFANANGQLTEGLNTFNFQIESDGCGIVDAAGTLTVTLFESINPDLTVISPDICTGDAQVNIEITNAQEGKTYQLMDGGNVIATQTATSANSLMFSLASDQFTIGSNVLNIDISDDNCGTTSAIQSVTFEKIDVVEIAQIDNQNICLNESLTIDLSANATMSSYQLFVGEELVQDAVATSLSLTPTETTTYTLTGIPENGCSVNTINFTIEVTDLAKPGILASANVLESSIEGDSYQWYLNGEILSGETAKVVVANQSGDYSVEVTKANCSALSDAFTFNEEVLNANKALQAALNLYPNPVEDQMFIELNDINSVNVTIFTLSGKFIDSFVLESSQSIIDMSKFSKGTYLMQFESGKGSVTKRIVKQ
ncbi:T9SS type A sorting domain-containing protein [Marivirga sp.]|uniref:T9SS type A sorting domain-containing protein n=1 Tax=Marivirga sp. TaxID=2018662 RepID=UPI0025ED5B4B|nr:T9SS type A sorting domain-containing protein [Marivirga sp.]